MFVNIDTVYQISKAKKKKNVILIRSTITCAILNFCALLLCVCNLKIVLTCIVIVVVFVVFIVVYFLPLFSMFSLFPSLKHQPKQTLMFDHAVKINKEKKYTQREKKTTHQNKQSRFNCGLVTISRN